MRIADFPISRRIHLITVAATLGLLALLAVNVLDVGSVKREDIALKTRHVVEAAHGVLAHF